MQLAHGTSNGIRASISITPAARVAAGETPPTWVPIKEEPAFTPRRLKIICVGAGFSGLTLAHKIKYELQLEDVVDYVIYEKNHEVGGTWTENRYPGVACDVPAHAYTFLFEPNPDWSHFYAPGAEIRQYIHRTARKWNLDDHVQLNTRVVEAVWDEPSGKWKLKIEQNGTIQDDEAEIFINASGFANDWSWPDIQGLSDFKGKLVHTAGWDDTYDWQDKRVAVIGNGASGMQCVAKMHAHTGRLVNYVRNPTWVADNFAFQMTKNGRNFAYTEEEREAFRTDRKAFFEFRKELENATNQFAYAMLAGHEFNGLAEGGARHIIHTRLKDSLDPSIAENMIPDFKPGCRRLTPGDGYLEAFSDPKVRMCRVPIQRVTETGITTGDGDHEEFDLIVCATGFNTSYLPRYKSVGRGGITLDERWKNDPEAFFSVHAEGMPNFFMIGGPNFTVSHGSLLAGVSFVCDYIVRWIRKITTEDIKSIDVKKDSIDEYNIWAQEYLKRTAWAGTCRSWYKNGKTTGQVTGNYPGTTSHFKKALENLGGEHFDIRHRSANRFQFLGNGQLDEEKNGKGDLASYFVESLW
ncbi:hypothetical protein N7492_007925 [Penicillium capsulatum]|uniref:FAD/NAD(P)-binding domain-containing protein n=1 Tax=Penicillium capsulatum TaxID=69766 RepID=A0A9W9I0P3_9EURO|nr:hypothetical protein N7492_007925 [Penicillium capsulatum]KAJ6117754.1 hypothetical protein N7512_007479 [Penicillium capsulatum]